MEEENKIGLHQIIWYLVIFSIIGLIVETLFCYFTTGALESRKGLIFGPFCPIYGVGATGLIFLLNRFKEDKIKLFYYGGRICVTYTLFWGVLAFILIKIAKPIIDKLINKINYKIIDVAIVIFAIIDVVCTIWGINVYRNRAIQIYYGTNVETKKSIINDIENEIFENSKMQKNFPNLRFINENGEEIWIRDIL